ncbi:bromodomain-containing protein 4-like isoform X2 [Cloeon dipterum]|uniref:bromodomain-containing protein 4-like isoform X2 n=1 Tax=Cloeon dipterum TaxID=197152 RepID=UPI00321FFEB3
MRTEKRFLSRWKSGAADQKQSRGWSSVSEAVSETADSVLAARSALRPTDRPTATAAGKAGRQPERKREPNRGNVSALNDGQLKALLDEAYSYKRPKDRVGKSEIFNELLKTVETSEEDSNDNAFLIDSRLLGPKRRAVGRREKGGSERQSHCLSLQNINQCHQGDPPARRHGTHQFRRGASTSSTCSSVMSESVSTRQREGGSLPCSVNEMHHNFHAEEGYGKSSQRASLEELNLMGLHSRRESKEHRRMASSPPGTEMTTFEPREEKAHTQALEMEMQMVSNAAKLKDNLPEPSSSYKTFASFSVSEPEEVDKAILLRSPDTFELGLQQETASVTSVLCDKPPISTQSPAILKTQSKPATKLPPNYKMDENENMPGSNSDSSNARKVKKSKKKQDNVVPSEKIEGYVGNKHLAYLLEYIGEKTTNKGSKVVLTNDLKHKEPRVGDLNVSRRNQRYSEDGKREQQKQSAKVGRKGAGEGGQNKIKRANSLEEVSKSKLEDITIPPYCRSIGGEDRTSEANKDLDDEEEYNRLLDEQNGNASVKSEDSQGNLIYSDSNPLSNEDSFEFQTVTNSKKQRRRKQKDQSASHSYIRGGGGMGYEEDSHHHHLPHHPHAGGRRKLKSTCSVPPSDQSGVDSSDDCDSVHSMPASSHLPLAAAVAHAPDHAAIMSYAAIARNPPPPPTPVATTAAVAEESWPQVVEETSSSVSSITTEPNTPPEETTVNVLHDYYPSLAESVKGGSRKASEEPPALAPVSLPPPKVPNGDVKRQASLPPKMVPAAAPVAPVKAKSATPPAVSCPPKQQQQRTLQNQPPVIFDEKTQCSDSVEGLTFGFSVNASLMDELGPLPTPMPPPPSQLDCAPVLSSPPPPLAKQKAVPPRPTATAPATPACVEAAAPVVSSHLSDVPTTKKTKDFAAMFRQPTQPLLFSEPTLSNNYKETVEFIGNAWHDTELELSTAGSSNRNISWFCP